MADEIKTKQVNVYLTEEQLEKLNKISEGSGLSRSALIRVILDEGIRMIEKNGLQLRLFKE